MGMSLSVGARVGPYEITGSLGAGGMGEVYRAYDTRLKRDVALKILPESFANDPERLARFQREAEMLASLNHPNIAAIYGIEEAPTTRDESVARRLQPALTEEQPTRALVLELVEGETLAERIARGPIPREDALPIAKEIAEALEAAHESGVIHRDLKPANIKVRGDGAVKVLDFGLAKLADASASPGAPLLLSNSPTLTSPAINTGVGVLLGTAAYMAPEQARGRAVDRRVDIWAFGCVLFEMLSGRRAFEGEDVAETLGAVIHKEPAWKALPADTPAWLRTLLRRCLQKDPRKRLPHIGVARIDIDDTPADGARPSDSATGIPRHRMWSDVRFAWSATAFAVAAAIVLGVVTYLADETEDALVTRTSILPPAGIRWANLPPNTSLSLSPDGRRLAFLGTDANGTRLWVRPIGAVTAQPLAGTEGVVLAAWSPDSRFLAFVAGGSLRKMDASGGPSIRLADKATNFGLAWSPQGDILFAPDGAGPLFRVSASGGEPSPATTLDQTNGETGHGSPFFLPDGRRFLYAVRANTPDANEPRGVSVYVGSLDAGERRLLLQGAYNAQYASGYLLFTRDATLMAQPFDAGRLELTGEAVPLAEQLRLGGATGRAAAVSASQATTLVYQTGPAGYRSQLTWYDRAGKPVGSIGEPADQISIELSPDGTRALASLSDGSRRTRDLWIYDLRRGLRTRFTFDPANESVGAWSPDGERVVFNSSRRAGSFDLYQKASDGSGREELLVSDDHTKEPHGWSPDGRTLAYSAVDARTLQDLWTVGLTGEHKPAVFLQTPFIDVRPRISPDGRWLAYSSNESGRAEIYVTTFPNGSGKWQVSTAGGNFPRWRKDGKEIFYLSPDNALTVAVLSTAGATFQVSNVQRLFEIRPGQSGIAGQGVAQGGYAYDVSADGQRFLVNTLVEEDYTEPLTLLVNWPALLRR